MIVRTRRLLQASIVLGALAAASCTQKLVEPPPPVTTVTAVPDSIQEVFTQNCALSTCHTGPNPQQGQDLTDAVTSYANIVGIASHEKPAFQRIAPGDSANSYIVMKLRNDPRKGGQPMPLGAFPLDAALTMRIAAWAQQGAPGVEVPAARIAGR
jgi:mono/diheme cytochrome c family protein